MAPKNKKVPTALIPLGDFLEMTMLDWKRSRLQVRDYNPEHRRTSEPSEAQE